MRTARRGNGLHRTELHDRMPVNGADRLLPEASPVPAPSGARSQKASRHAAKAGATTPTDAPAMVNWLYCPLRLTVWLRRRDYPSISPPEPGCAGRCRRAASPCSLHGRSTRPSSHAHARRSSRPASRRQSRVPVEIGLRSREQPGQDIGLDASLSKIHSLPQSRECQVANEQGHRRGTLSVASATINAFMKYELDHGRTSPSELLGSEDFGPSIGGLMRPETRLMTNRNRRYGPGHRKYRLHPDR
jgi:hypothetical protein